MVSYVYVCKVKLYAYRHNAANKSLIENCVSEFNNWMVSSKTSLGVPALPDTTVVLIPSNRCLVVVFNQCFTEFKIIY